MKEFVKMTLATLTGLLLFGFISMFIMIGMIGAIAAAGSSKPVMPAEAVLSIDFSKMTLAEQSEERFSSNRSSTSEVETSIRIRNSPAIR